MKNEMKIKHNPFFDVGIVTEHYSKKDGVPVNYVCTTDLRASDVPVDVYYRPTPHPEFGNHYFGLYYDNVRGHVMICNADIVEELEFGLVTDGEEWHYSESHHSYKTFPNGAMIDGGRAYIRSSGPVKHMRILNGKWVKQIFAGDTYVYPGSDCQI